jgi:hypothetical protein
MFSLYRHLKILQMPFYHFPYRPHRALAAHMQRTCINICFIGSFIESTKKEEKGRERGGRRRGVGWDEGAGGVGCDGEWGLGGRSIIT